MSSFTMKQLVIALLMYVPILLYADNASAQGQANAPAQIQAVYIEEDFDIDAKLKNPAWGEAYSAYIEHQIQPDDKAPALVETEVKVLYSKDNLYIGFICDDPNPVAIRANISDRDNSFQDDYVGVFLDPFNNNQNAYELFVNPLGIQMDGMRSGNNEDMNFDILWHSEGEITSTGYRAVMKIPFKSLNFPEQDVQRWSIQFLRNYPRNSRYQFTW